MRLFPFLLLFAAASAWGEPREIVVCEYNVENYVDAIPAGQGSKFGTHEKSEKAAEALVHIVHEINPDILGVCEMGSPARFEDFKKRLAAAGLGYTDFESGNLWSFDSKSTRAISSESTENQSAQRETGCAEATHDHARNRIATKSIRQVFANALESD